MDKYNKLRDLIINLDEDAKKFYEKQNNAAGTRVRKGMQDIKDLAQEIRKEVQDIKNAAGEGE